MFIFSKRTIVILFFCIAASVGLYPKTSFRLKILRNGRIIGHSDVRIKEKDGQREVTIVSHVRYKSLIRNIRLKKVTKYIVSKSSGIRRFFAQSKVTPEIFAGLNIKRDVYRRGQQLHVRTIRQGNVKTRKYRYKKDYDFTTGEMIKRMVNPGNRVNRFRFLDLEEGKLEWVRYRLLRVHERMINNQSMKVFDIKIDSPSKNQHLTILVDYNIPIRFVFKLPIVGRLEAKLMKHRPQVGDILPNIHI